MNPRAKVKHKVGTGECFACKREVVWRQSEGGALTATCQHCDMQSYAKHGTEAERLILKSITRTAPEPEKAPAPKPAPAAAKAEPVPEAKPKPTGVFGLGGF